jgi:hypothetical protein
MKVTHMMVLAKLDDGTMHPVDLPGKQASQIKGYLTHIQGGKLRLRGAPLTEDELKEILKK